MISLRVRGGRNKLDLWRENDRWELCKTTCIMQKVSETSLAWLEFEAFTLYMVDDMSDLDHLMGFAPSIATV